jgi:hypothetical protein
MALIEPPCASHDGLADGQAESDAGNRGFAHAAREPGRRPCSGCNAYATKMPSALKATAAMP